MKLVACCAVFALAACPAAFSQDDSDVPLGDVARMMREKPAPAQNVIDNDNLEKVMDQAESHRLSPISLQYSITDGGKTFRVGTADATCSLAFSVNAKALLSTQYKQMDLSPGDIAKLSGPASIQGDSLEISLYNGTEWHVSEVAIVLTLVKRAHADDASAAPDAPLIPLDPQAGFVIDNRSQKKSDQALVYKMRQAAPPFETTVYRVPLDTDIGSDQEWHWSIIQAKGYPPQAALQRASNATAITTNAPETAIQNTLLPSPAAPVIPSSLTTEMSDH